eukprot:CAMPEP_0117030980 /NCGR_PEP_ID=MMETSP0472-20121206/22320_1 /TAXON_ID=693140 ORGANISM="Tiarina fusus, Strain LIS" /NCGR_SAMPLE_ID=MMETSP0472 /ASSEMBLY_ACC=CAM_ASM_000603 /LENGTH=253 /DNA_ID=CAMNT_0004739211 /DNA_START=7 /DNA_END=768 /DNA_ORIENTATION=-
MATSSSFLVGKLALVTGGSGTIGKAIAKGLASHGASVVLTARRTEKLEQAQQALMGDVASADIHIIASDVSKEESVVALFEKIDQIGKGKGLDLLINNAGTMAPGPTVDLTADDMQRVLSVNVVGPFLCAREAMKRMKIAGGGRIINIGSISSSSPRPDGVTYTTSKFAMQGLSRSLALDGRRDNIAVGSIHPGNVVSELLSPEVIAEREATEGFIQPEDVANCVLTMASLPYSANVLDLTVIPTRQPFVGRG